MEELEAFVEKLKEIKTKAVNDQNYNFAYHLRQAQTVIEKEIRIQQGEHILESAGIKVKQKPKKT